MFERLKQTLKSRPDMGCFIWIYTYINIYIYKLIIGHKKQLRKWFSQCFFLIFLRFSFYVVTRVEFFRETFSLLFVKCFHAFFSKPTHWPKFYVNVFSTFVTMSKENQLLGICCKLMCHCFSNLVLSTCSRIRYQGSHSNVEL